MTLWVIQKKPIKLLIDLNPEDLEDAQDIGGNAGDRGRFVPPVITSLQEKEDVKNTLNEQHDWFVDYVPKPIKMLWAKPF